jgi:hypothetical protein
MLQGNLLTAQAIEDAVDLAHAAVPEPRQRLIATGQARQWRCRYGLRCALWSAVAVLGHPRVSMKLRRAMTIADD